jgi:hypothetical protein
MVIERECRPVRRVLLMCDKANRDAAEELTSELAPRGIEARIVLTPGEALWALEDSSKPNCAVIIDGDHGVPDQLGLLTFLRDHHPLVHRVMVMTTPPAPEIDGCAVVARDALDVLETLFETQPS